MKINKKATSIAEAMIMMMIVVTGVTGMYKVYDSSVKLERATNNKIIAINMAREGVEAMKNIRNTNWILFSSDFSNCWNTLNYQNACVGDDTGINKLSAGYYKIYKDIDNRWKVEQKSGDQNYWTSEVQNFYKVQFDSNGFYTQSGGIDIPGIVFIRQVIIQYLHDTNGDGNKDRFDEKMTINSKVTWLDNTSEKTHNIMLTSILSNWKK